MKEFTESTNTLLERFQSDENNGLTTKQAEKNREKYGQNTLTKKKGDSLIKRIWDAATEPMLLMLIGAGAIALGVNIFREVTGGEADFLECVGIFAAISLSVIISVVMEGKSAKAFEALSKISENIVVKVIRNGETVMLKQQDVVVGDILILSTGDKISADGRLIESTGLAVDESALTGESEPAQKDAKLVITDEKTPLAERGNMLYSGTYVTSGNCKMVVTAVGDNTEFGKIAGELSGDMNSSTPLQEKLARLGKTITVMGVAAAAVVFVSQLISFKLHNGLVLEEVMEAFVTSIVLIVAAVPEGLPTIVAVSLSINIIKLSKNNALVKKMIASETVGCINVICSDKTGTLTENKMTVRSYFDKTLHQNCIDVNNPFLIRNICLNSTAQLGKNGEFIGNPTECAMLKFYENSSYKKDCKKSYEEIRESYSIFQAFPFNSDDKHMTTVAEENGRLIAYTKGSPEAILDMCLISEDDRKYVESQITKVQQQAMRVIAFSHKNLSDRIDYKDENNHILMESDMEFDGFVAIADPLRKEVYDAVKSCEGAGVELKILTGDNIVTASAIADELGLLEKGKVCVEAKDIAEISDEELSEKLKSICVIARSTPVIKMRIVKLLKEQGNVVAVTGDG